MSGIVKIRPAYMDGRGLRASHGHYYVKPKTPFQIMIDNQTEQTYGMIMALNHGAVESKAPLIVGPKKRFRLSAVTLNGEDYGFEIPFPIKIDGVSRQMLWFELFFTDKDRINDFIRMNDNQHPYTVYDDPVQTHVESNVTFDAISRVEAPVLEDGLQVYHVNLIIKKQEPRGSIAE